MKDSTKEVVGPMEIGSLENFLNRTEGRMGGLPSVAILFLFVAGWKDTLELDS